MQIFKKNHGLGTTALIISNEEMERIMEKIKSPEESGLVMQGISKTIKNEAEEQKSGFHAMLLGELAASILRIPLAAWEVIRATEGTIRADEYF